MAKRRVFPQRRKQNPKDPSPSLQKGSRLETLEKRISTLTAILVRIYIIFVLLAFTVIIIDDITSKRVVLGPFEIPSKLTEQGISSTVFSQMLMDQIDVINQPWTDEVKDYKSKVNTPSINAQVAGVSFSLSQLANYLSMRMGWFHKAYTGEVVLMDSTLIVNVRRSKDGKSVSSLSMDIKDIGTHQGLTEISLLSAENIVSDDNEIILAYYYLLEKDKRDRAESIALNLVTKNTDEVWAYELLGMISELNSNNEAAARYYRSSIDNNPNVPRPWRKLIFIHEQKGDIDSAIAVCEERLTFDPNSKWTYFTLGRLQRENGEYELAKQTMEKLLKLDPENERIETEIEEINQLIPKQ